MRNLYLALLLPFLLGGCSSEPSIEQSQTQESASFTIDEAKTFFEDIILSNANSEIESCKNVFAPGEFTPLWNNAICSTEGGYYCIQVPINTQYRFRAIRSEFKNCNAQAYGVDAEQRLILLKSRATNSLSMLIVTLIPDRDYADSNKDRTTGRTLSGRDKERFEGLVLGHSVIRGRLFSVEKYEAGFRKKRVCFYNEHEICAEEILAANEMLKNVSILKKAIIQTRDEYESPWEVCVCGGQGCPACNGVGQDWGQNPKPGDNNPGSESGGGSGGGGDFNPGSPDFGSGGTTPPIDPTPTPGTGHGTSYCASCGMKVSPDSSGYYDCSNCGHATRI